jgi:hypothetical protein
LRRFRCDYPSERPDYRRDDGVGRRQGGLAWRDGLARAHRSALGILVHIVATLLRTCYAPALALGTNATQAQLDEVFREEYGISDITVRKAIAFFLAAAKFAKLEVRPHFTMPRTTSAAGGSRRRRTGSKPDVDTTPAATADPMVALRTTYVETLRDKFAQANGEVDSELADRVEG